MTQYKLKKEKVTSNRLKLNNVQPMTTSIIKKMKVAKSKVANFLQRQTRIDHSSVQGILEIYNDRKNYIYN